MADNYYGGGGGGNDWEVVSLTASTYAAAPGPVLPDAQKKAELPPAAAAPAIFMSQHFNLPAAEPLSADLNGGIEHQFSPAVVDDEAVFHTDDLIIPCPGNDRETEMQDDGLTLTSSDYQQSVVSTTTLGLDDAISFADAGNVLLLQAGAMPVCLPGEEEEERQSTIVGFHATQPDAAASDTTSVHQHVTAGSHNAIAAYSASLAADHVVPVAGVTPVAPNKQDLSSSKIPCEAQAWWNKTFRFLRNNSKESLTFRFIFVAATIVGLAVLGQRDKVQLRLEFNVDTEKISCAVREPLGQVKLNMLVGGSPVARG